ncbi:outer membrane protein assembly factor BamE domain-containing protein [Marinobacter subterrani]|uniref:outer membrane protein assembly factor BamE domain-containing protein n=1 Tax=Marinobacter subterrani TaxID=1658765 RepID=UPI00235567CA|nr:outer membrane protein assembly factor BamE [Marinobacter subterrani]
MKKTTTKLCTAIFFTGFLTGCATTNQNGENPLLNAAQGVAKGIGSVASALVPEPYTNGVYVAETDLQKLKPGMTQSEVERLIGLPPEITQSEQGEIWSYPFTKITHFSGNVNETTIVRFDESGLLAKAYKTNSRSSKTGNPLVDAANGTN